MPRGPLLAIGLGTLLFATSACAMYPYMSGSELPDDSLTYVDFYPVDQPERSDDVYRIMSYNIGYFSGMQNNKPVSVDAAIYLANQERIVDMLLAEQADILALQEIDYFGSRSHYVNQPEVLASQAGYAYNATAINWDTNYLPFPYWPPSVHYGRMKSGQTVLSRFPIDVNQRIALPKPISAPFFINALYLDRLAQVTRVRLEATDIIVVNIHLEAFDQITREIQAPLVRDIVNRYLDDYPVILIGDFNTVPPWASQQGDFEDEPGVDFSEDTTLPTFLNHERLSPAVSEEAYRADESAWFTYPGDEPTRQLDYVFYSHESIEPVDVYVVHEVGDPSDHRPLVFHFRLKSQSAATEQDSDSS